MSEQGWDEGAGAPSSPAGCTGAAACCGTSTAAAPKCPAGRAGRPGQRPCSCAPQLADSPGAKAASYRQAGAAHARPPRRLAAAGAAGAAAAPPHMHGRRPGGPLNAPAPAHAGHPVGGRRTPQRVQFAELAGRRATMASAGITALTAGEGVSCPARSRGGALARRTARAAAALPSHARCPPGRRRRCCNTFGRWHRWRRCAGGPQSPPPSAAARLPLARRPPLSPAAASLTRAPPPRP